MPASPPTSVGRLPAALFFDLDGTLLAPGAVLTGRTAAALQAAAGAGATLVLSTGGFSGRTHHLARILGASIPQGVWTVTHNGAAIWDPAGRLVHHHPLPGAALEAALAHAGPRVWVTYEAVDHRPAEGESHTGVYYAGRLRHEMVPFLWGPQEERGDQGNRGPRATAPGGDVPVGLEPRWDWRRARSPATYNRAAVLGAWCIGSPEALAALDAQVEGGRLRGARYLPWSSRLGQLLGRPRLNLAGRDMQASGCSKGAAASWLCHRLGIDPQDTAAFGDADNDLELLDFAGTAVVMANATPRVMALAQATPEGSPRVLVAPSNREDGVARVLASWLARARVEGPSLAGTSG
ncbi:MAG TPA: HAD family hydrolase [Chloroflexota bacterium]|nr:HAD family hydrolase [Chloroflexota bacterium]